MHRFIHISIGYSRLNPSPQILEPTMAALSDDWARYNFNCWILWTNKSSIVCMQAIKELLAPEDQLLIHKMDLSEIPIGLLPQWLWDWINRQRNPFSGAIEFPQALPTAFGLPTYPSAVRGAGSVPSALGGSENPIKPTSALSQALSEIMDNNKRKN